MKSAELVLQFELQVGHYADAIVSAESLIAWVTMIKQAALAIDPDSPVDVELVGREKGSLKQVLRVVERAAKDIQDGAGEFPTLKKAALGLALASAGGVSGTLFSQAIQPTVQKVELVHSEHQQLGEMQGKIDASPSVASAKRDFFRAVSRDPAITTVQVKETEESLPMVSIDRDEFAVRGTEWSQDAPATPERQTRRDVWRVVLIRAPFDGNPKSWTFSRDGVLFSARMEDAAFLQAIRDGRVPITLQEGVLMRIEVEYRERLVGQVWQYVDRTRKVIHVLSPEPLAVPVALPPAGSPKQR